jgi:hypothetical protein
VEKRVPTWQSVGLSSGGKMILVESCLSSIPMYSMGIYHLQEEIHQKIDAARAKFFWHGPNLKKKYHMAKWELMMTPKNAGGVGFTNTRVMNRCLLAKWLLKIETGEDNLCCNLLRQKYLGEREIFSYKRNNGSQFWKGLMSVREDVVRGLTYILGDGKKIRFWLDVWMGSCALKVTFPRLFEICNQQEWSVSRVLRDGNLNMTFRRNFGAAQEVEWADLTTMMENTHLTLSLDTMRWVFEKSGQFSITSLYRELVFLGVVNKWMMSLWRARLPLKIKSFLWKICNDKIQSVEELKKKN